MKKEISLSKRNIILIKIVLILSSPFFTILLSNRFDPIYVLIGALLSFICMLVLIWKKLNIEKLEFGKIIISFFIACYCIGQWLYYSKAECNISALYKLFDFFLSLKLSVGALKIILGVFALPFTIFLVYLFIDKVIVKVKKIFSTFTVLEKKYLKIVFACAVILSVFISFKTTVFTVPYDPDVRFSDIIYTTDSGALLKGNSFVNVSDGENDIRQPLFGVFALPFSISASFLSQFCFFLPSEYAYAIIMMIMQFLLLALTTVMLGKILEISEDDKKLFYLFFSSSFTYILFSFVIEQYVIALFYLISTIYYYKIKPKNVNYLYAGAMGTLLTSGILFPLVSKFSNFKTWILNILKCFGMFLLMILLFGQFPQILTGNSRFNELSKFFGDLALSDRINQFTNFVSGIFVAPSATIKTAKLHVMYQLSEFSTISILGIIILICAVVSFILNHKNLGVKIAFFWILFSFVILFVIGWGMQENGLILYSLYFGWAYLLLIFMLFKRIFQKKTIFKIVILICCVLMLYFNINEFIDIIKFGIKYYPCVL